MFYIEFGWASGINAK